MAVDTLEKNFYEAADEGSSKYLPGILLLDEFRKKNGRIPIPIPIPIPNRIPSRL
uniref:Uncharacterized protein n=1 Tax=Rhizophagus irregularis (strain DAOM 181602 / DAOM 197198 / MUCL 43194) TaxID=747089 RepID=U9UJ56_RHIID